MIRERTRAGLQAARAQGRHGGRRPKLTPVQRGEIVDMVLSGRKTAADVARLFGIHPATVSRLISLAHRLTYDSEQTLR
jgi:DNA invertase Pin-like site-specific DNA recombinase